MLVVDGSGKVGDGGAEVSGTDTLGTGGVVVGSGGPVVSPGPEHAAATRDKTSHAPRRALIAHLLRHHPRAAHRVGIERIGPGFSAQQRFVEPEAGVLGIDL